VRSVELRAPASPEKQPTFPEKSDFTRDDYGPVPVPEENQTVQLTDSTWSLYKKVIRKYEGHRAERVESGVFQIEGQWKRRYTFEQDYFFVMGDNRDNSLDSRFCGYVPRDHLNGEAVMTLFSWIVRIPSLGYAGPSKAWSSLEKSNGGRDAGVGITPIAADDGLLPFSKVGVYPVL
jgi:hypothetical protein